MELVSIEGQQSTFSGAQWNQELDALLFTASLEVELNKGPFLSFIGTISGQQLATGRAIKITESSMTLLRHQGQPLQSKIESVVVKRVNEQQVFGILAADNDDGTSQFMHVVVPLSALQ